MTYDFAFCFNLIEALIWFSISVKFATLAIKNATALKRAFIVFSLTMFLFGISDLIELFTRAWYKPVGLFLLKASCVVSIAYCVFVFFRNRKEFENIINNRN